jgi:ABC-2 type transport system permease protein
MRSFSEEKKVGTIEILTTKPISDLAIIMGKFFAGFTLVLFSLIPTLIYFYSVYQLGETVGNIDTGATIGSYIGLLMLGAVYVAIGIFASAITENQIVSFVLSLFVCFIFYMAFDYLGNLDIFQGTDFFLEWIGINYHYRSISKGVLDTRDVIYFLSLTGLFIWLTKIVFESRKW